MDPATLRTRILQRVPPGSPVTSVQARLFQAESSDSRVQSHPGLLEREQKFSQQIFSDYCGQQERGVICPIFLESDLLSLRRRGFEISFPLDARKGVLDVQVRLISQYSFQWMETWLEP